MDARVTLSEETGDTVLVLVALLREEGDGADDDVALDSEKRDRSDECVSFRREEGDTTAMTAGLSGTAQRVVPQVPQETDAHCAGVGGATWEVLSVS